MMLNYVIQNYAYSMGHEHEIKKTESNETESFFKLKKLQILSPKGILLAKKISSNNNPIL